MSAAKNVPDPVIDKVPLSVPEEVPQVPPLDYVLVLYAVGREPAGFLVSQKTCHMILGNIMAGTVPATESAPAREIKHLIFDHANGTAVFKTDAIQFANMAKANGQQMSQPVKPANVFTMPPPNSVQ